ncbi:MAG: hypothetical protein Q4G08_04215 [Capnocytophaga sp.]|nr:hypothetical protein [Capnocytophaga sp.]
MFEDTINGKNMYADFGLIIQTGTASLLAFPERKETHSNDWREENGTEYDLGMPRFNDKEVVLNGAFMADDDASFWRHYDAFFDELKKPGWQRLYIADHGRTYSFFYRKSGEFQKSSRRLKGVNKVFVKFEITIVVQ